MDFVTIVHPDGPGSLNEAIGDGIPAYLGCSIAECRPDELEEPSPLYNILPSNPAFLLINGDAEMTPAQQASIFHDALSAAGVSSTLNITTGVPGRKHGSSMFNSQEKKIVEFLRTTDAPYFTVGDVSVTEGNSTTKLMTFPVTLAGASQVGPSTVDYATSDGTATAGSDYVATSGTLTFPVGPSPQTQSITVAINGDTTAEADESLLLTLDAPGDATIADAQAQGTILTDDAGDPSAPTVTVSDRDETDPRSQRNRLGRRRERESDVQ